MEGRGRSKRAGEQPGPGLPARWAMEKGFTEKLEPVGDATRSVTWKDTGVGGRAGRRVASGPLPGGGVAPLATLSAGGGGQSERVMTCGPFCAHPSSSCLSSSVARSCPLQAICPAPPSAFQQGLPVGRHLQRLGVGGERGLGYLLPLPPAETTLCCALLPPLPLLPQ